MSRVKLTSLTFSTPTIYQVDLDIISTTGVYILVSQKNSSPPPVKFFPVFVDFLGVFKLHKGILTCVLSLFSFFLLFPLFLSFFQVLLQILPCFSIWTEIRECPEHVSLFYNQLPASQLRHCIRLTWSVPIHRLIDL